MNKKQLYESIMRLVSKEVKNALNEGIIIVGANFYDINEFSVNEEHQLIIDSNSYFKKSKGMKPGDIVYDDNDKPEAICISNRNGNTKFIDLNSANVVDEQYAFDNATELPNKEDIQDIFDNYKAIKKSLADINCPLKNIRNIWCNEINKENENMFTIELYNINTPSISHTPVYISKNDKYYDNHNGLYLNIINK